MATSQSKNSVVADWVQLLELLNKVWDLVNLIEARFSRGYAKTVVLSCFQRWGRAFVLPS